MKKTVCTYNKIDAAGLAVLHDRGYEVAEGLADAEAILLRSHKLQSAEMSESLLAIGRAGAGVNNIPVDLCTERGVVVFNAPGANANAVAELALAMLLACRRRVPAALTFLQKLPDIEDATELDTEVEAQKKAFRGAELYGTTLGVVGLGAIGSRLAHCAVEMGVEVMGYDPAISVENAWRLPANVKRCSSLEELLLASDAVSLHVPALPSTQHLINAGTLAAMRPGAQLLNYARHEIVDERAVVDSLHKGHLGMYACDFPSPLLRQRQRDHGDVFLTPHLGASTSQAEANSSVMAAKQLDDFLSSGSVRNSVNFPTLVLERQTPWRLAVANQNIPSILNHLTAELANRSINVADMTNKSRDAVAWNLIDLDQEPHPSLIEALQNIEGVLRVRVLTWPED